MYKRLPLVVAFAVAALAMAAQDSIPLTLKVKKDQTFTYQNTIATDFQGMTITISGKTISTVVSVSDKEVVWKNVSTEQKIDAGGMMDSQPDSELTLVQTPLGKIIRIESDAATNDESIRITNAFNFFYPEKPVKVGEKWTIKSDANSELGTVAIESTYEAKELKEVDGKKAIVLNFRTEEKVTDGIVAEGSMVVDLDNGMPLSVDAKFTNVPQMGMLFAGTYKMQLVKN